MIRLSGISTKADELWRLALSEHFLTVLLIHYYLITICYNATQRFSSFQQSQDAE